MEHWDVNPGETGMAVRDKKFVPKGRARTLGTMRDKLAAARDAYGKAPRKAKKKTTKKRKSAKRDHTAYSPAKKRTVKRRTVRSATGPWVFRDPTYVKEMSYTTTSRSPAKKRAKKRAKRDPAWYGESRRHATAAKKGIRKSPKRKAIAKRAKAKRGRRDPAWYGDKARHSAAARFGWGERFGPENIITRAHPYKDTPSEKKYGRLGPKRDGLSRGTRDPAWYGEPRRHAKAARSGWKKVAKKGWTPKHGRDPNYFHSATDLFGRAPKRRAKSKRPTRRGLPRDSQGHFLPRGSHARAMRETY